jgi:CheY-like chemotaxis protein
MKQIRTLSLFLFSDDDVAKVTMRAALTDKPMSGRIVLGPLGFVHYSFLARRWHCMSLVRKDMAIVLIVDDQRESGHLLTRILRYLGHQSVHVPSGADALDYVRDNLPDAVLLDYMMPGMDGLEVLKKLRENPRTRQVPVIMFSANNDPKLVETALREGASDYWVKASLAINEMESRLTRWLHVN